MNNSTIETMKTNENTQERIIRLESALNLALHILGAQEPPDSRAVSDEFVAMSSVLAGCENTNAMKIIDEGMNIPREYVGLEITV